MVNSSKMVIPKLQTSLAGHTPVLIHSEKETKGGETVYYYFSNDTQQFIINCGSPKLGDYYRSLKSGQMCNQNPGSAYFTRKDILAT